jgi:hypothetical protein
MPQFRDCPTAGLGTAMKTVARARITLAAPNVRSRPESAQRQGKLLAHHPVAGRMRDDDLARSR